MSRVIVALDFQDRLDALQLVGQLDPARCRLKVGKEMFTRFGPGFVQVLQGRGFDVFLDLKFHDIPNTAAAAVEAAADLGVWMVNVHASGGRHMLEACARQLAVRNADERPLLYGVTVLTSLTDNEIREIGWSGSSEEAVTRLAGLAHESGLDGVVCSAMEAELLKSRFGPGLGLVTPGIRPAFAVQGDQQRVMTPAKALAAGSDYLVIGRPITRAEDPMEALAKIEAEIAG
ncbi:orotidine-5'-phosphate decarboxylase [Halospina denitrificans]|uniref:Orotidine 5'-phosphate decarboxylase n=1 Tax=Halospina denitrificans TaxID=332522 RepID=A0A4V3ER31_9GAMM|nr:orotidine-5'-phosphate decarboxylase [Halospina denitrificans]TDT43028.1 orotidine-5'-phosphate decarboxylase [Halospina denitrificans]